MKSPKIITIISLTAIILFSGCKKEKEIVYYNFGANDRTQTLPHYTEGMTLSFKNENESTRTFIVKTATETKERFWHNGGMMSESYDTYWHDVKRISLFSPDGGTFNVDHIFTITIERKPIYDMAEYEFYETYPSKLFVTISDFPFWADKFNSNELGYITDRAEMTFNGHAYHNVITDHAPAYLTEGVLTLYYDEIYGIIGFDDGEGHQWRLENNFF
jgi:hypothetical protein